MLYGGVCIKINSKFIIVCLLVLLALTVSVSFASEESTDGFHKRVNHFLLMWRWKVMNLIL